LLNLHFGEGAMERGWIIYEKDREEISF